MRSILTIFVLSLLVISAVPAVLADSVGGEVNPDIGTEDFEPLVWLCGERVVLDGAEEPGRVSDDGDWMMERLNNYAFEGEQIHWLTLVMDKNGIDKILDVYGSIGSSQGGGDIEVNCQRIGWQGDDAFDACNARILEEQVEWDHTLMDFYSCTLTVETADSMYGEYWITVEAEDYDGLMGYMDEYEYWFLNPIIALSIDGALEFEDVRPGASAYSSTLLVGNDADAGSGVMLDMFISGTDFYDSSSSGAMCPDTNQLQLWGPGPDGQFHTEDDTGFFYFATHGAYSSFDDAEFDVVDGDRDCNTDGESYCNIEYGIGFNDPDPFYDNTEILQAMPQGPYWVANTLSPGSEMALTFRLDLPEPCNGDFDTGSIYFWGEAI